MLKYKNLYGIYTDNFCHFFKIIFSQRAGMFPGIGPVTSERQL